MFIQENLFIHENRNRFDFSSSRKPNNHSNDSSTNLLMLSIETTYDCSPFPQSINSFHQAHLLRNAITNHEVIISITVSFIIVTAISDFRTFTPGDHFFYVKNLFLYQASSLTPEPAFSFSFSAILWHSWQRSAIKYAVFNHKATIKDFRQYISHIIKIKLHNLSSLMRLRAAQIIRSQFTTDLSQHSFSYNSNKAKIVGFTHQQFCIAAQ